MPRRWREDWGSAATASTGSRCSGWPSAAAGPRLVVCHLGGGCSVTAVLDGRSVDTTWASARSRASRWRLARARSTRARSSPARERARSSTALDELGLAALPRRPARLRRLHLPDRPGGGGDGVRARRAGRARVLGRGGENRADVRAAVAAAGASAPFASRSCRGRSRDRAGGAPPARPGLTRTLPAAFPERTASRADGAGARARQCPVATGRLGRVDARIAPAVSRCLDTYCGTDPAAAWSLAARGAGAAGIARSC